MDDKNPGIGIRAKVPSSGVYNLVLHYYQPDHANYDLDVLIRNGELYNAYAPIKHCPGRSGCRTVIRQRDPNTTHLQLAEDFILTIEKPSKKNIWVDYLLAVPAEVFDPGMLVLTGHDKLEEFLKQCGQNAFFIDPDDTTGLKL